MHFNSESDEEELPKYNRPKVENKQVAKENFSRNNKWNEDS